eukprot:scaffold94566_cov37-Prasinocladus_malaysianus.AAC.1
MYFGEVPEGAVEYTSDGQPTTSPSAPTAAANSSRVDEPAGHKQNERMFVLKMSLPKRKFKAIEAFPSATQLALRAWQLCEEQELEMPSPEWDT